MTALGDMLAKADEVLSAEQHGPWCGFCGGPMQPRAPDLARALKAVAEALSDSAFLEAALLEAFHHDDMGADIGKSIRAAIERRLTEGK